MVRANNYLNRIYKSMLKKNTNNHNKKTGYKGHLLELIIGITQLTISAQELTL